ncbi:MAG TPA: FtsX-like permease family protein [Thermoleophilaceae bacterium]|nr:FtsX-like permease family protein [Thermoleophilaceae bacterium]
MTSIALRNLAARKLRTFLTSLAVVLGVMMVAGTYVLTDTIDQSFGKIFEQGNRGIDAVVTSKEAVETDDGQEPSFDESVLDRVRETEGVDKAEGGIFDPTVSILDKDGEPIGGNGAPTFGASDIGEPFDALKYVEGGRPSSADQVVIDKQTAGRGDYSVGDRIKIVGKESAKEYELAGIATLGDVDSFGGASIAVFTFDEARRVTRKQGKLDQISIAAAEGVSPAELKRRLSQALPKSVEVETGTENTASQKEDVGEFIGFLKTALLIFAGVALFVAAFLIFNTFSITVAQRTREFAMLRTLGANRRQLVVSVVTEALVIGLIASVLGLLAGIGFAPAINALFQALEVDLPNEGTVIATRTIVVALVIGVGLTVLASLIPALRITRVPPVAGLREGAVLETPRGSRRRSAIATVITGLGVVAMLLGVFGVLSPGEAWVGVGAGAIFIGVALLSPRLVRPMASLVGRPVERFRGVAGRLARENAVRNPGRTASTAAALMIGLALVSFVAIFAAGLRGSIDAAFDKTIQGDLIVTNKDGFSDISLEVTDAIAEIDGVAVASPGRFTQANVAGEKGSYVTLVDPETVTEVQTLDWEEGDDSLLSGLGPRDAVADEKWAEKEKLEVGDTFKTGVSNGETLTYTVRGTFVDRADFNGDFVASDANAAAYGEPNSVQQVLVGLEEGASAGAVQKEIDRLAGSAFPTIEVRSQQEFKDFIGEEINQLLAVVYALLFLAVIVSLFGIVNTLALSIHERTRELGLLRAVGMSRRQVRRVIRWESVITAAIGAVLGSVLGVIFAVIMSRPLADEGFVLSIPVGTLIVLLLLALIAGVLAAIGPARRASRLDVLDALAYE